MQVRFVTNASWQGRSIRKGELLDMDDASAAAYIAVDQAVAVETVAGKPAAKSPEAPARHRRARADDE